MILGGDQIIWLMSSPDCNQINDLNADENVVVYGVDSLELQKPLHPNMSARFFFDAQLPAAMNSIVRCLEPQSPVSFRALAYARDMEPRHLFADFSANEVADRESKKAVIGIPNPSW